MSGGLGNQSFQLTVPPRAVKISLHISSHKKQQSPPMLQSQGLAGTAASDDLQSPQEVKASPNLKGQGPYFVHLPYNQNAVAIMHIASTGSS